MLTLILRGVAVFFFLIVATSVMIHQFKFEFGTVNFWDKRGVFFLFFITVFPRLTLLFSSVAFGGFFWWLGFFFVPRILVASLATVAYFQTNPTLVVISWLIAIGGEFFEKWGIGKNRFIIKTYRGGPRSTYTYQESSHVDSRVIRSDDTIEAEFTKKD